MIKEKQWAGDPIQATTGSQSCFQIKSLLFKRINIWKKESAVKDLERTDESRAGVARVD